MSARQLGGPRCPAHPLIHRFPSVLVPGGQEERRQDRAGVGSGFSQPCRSHLAMAILRSHVRHCLAESGAALAGGWGAAAMLGRLRGVGQGLGEATFSFTAVPLAFPEGPGSGGHDPSPLTLNCPSRVSRHRGTSVEPPSSGKEGRCV